MEPGDLLGVQPGRVRLEREQSVRLRERVHGTARQREGRAELLAQRLANPRRL
jgi:hypothetical protein